MNLRELVVGGNTADTLASKLRSAAAAFGAEPGDPNNSGALAEALSRAGIYAATDAGEPAGTLDVWNTAYWALIAALASVGAVRTHPADAQRISHARAATAEAVTAFAGAAEAHPGA
ncbi:hypothetical protein AB0N09_28145 [Streptomyces erythrochromogenes]|uniref:hypothetical protein n=1 Tax=Streptomyces erythrochromogenes TaxID=285574 RepID=UPI0034456368